MEKDVTEQERGFHHGRIQALTVSVAPSTECFT